MVTLFGIPADGALVFLASLAAVVVAFLVADSRTKGSKRLTSSQLEKARKHLGRK